MENKFLAYPSDRVGEALYIKKRQRYRDVGLISIALYWSHVIRRAILEEKEGSQEVLDDFSDESYWQEIREEEVDVSRGSKQIIDLVLDDTIHLEKKDWEFMTLLWASEAFTGVYACILYAFFNINVLIALVAVLNEQTPEALACKRQT